MEVVVRAASEVAGKAEYELTIMQTDSGRVGDVDVGGFAGQISFAKWDASALLDVDAVEALIAFLQGHR